MTKKKYMLILGLSMGLFVLSLVMFLGAFFVKENAAAGFYILLILAIASFVATFVLMFKYRKDIVAYEQGKKTPSKKSIKKSEGQKDKQIKKAENKEKIKKKEEIDA